MRPRPDGVIAVGKGAHEVVRVRRPWRRPRLVGLRRALAVGDVVPGRSPPKSQRVAGAPSRTCSHALPVRSRASTVHVDAPRVDRVETHQEVDDGVFRLRSALPRWLPFTRLHLQVKSWMSGVRAGSGRKTVLRTTALGSNIVARAGRSGTCCRRLTRDPLGGASPTASRFIWLAICMIGLVNGPSTGWKAGCRRGDMAPCRQVATDERRWPRSSVGRNIIAGWMIPRGNGPGSWAHTVPGLVAVELFHAGGRQDLDRAWPVWSVPRDCSRAGEGPLGGELLLGSRADEERDPDRHRHHHQ